MHQLIILLPYIAYLYNLFQLVAVTHKIQFLLDIIIYMTKNYTIRGKTDGFGAQYHAIMSGIVYCKFIYWNSYFAFIRQNQH
jgi:hypothetical protein